MPTPPPVVRLTPHRSVLHRGPRSRQLGLDPRTAVAVDDLTPALAAMLDELARPVSTQELVARAVIRGAGVGEATELLVRLVAAGIVVDATGPRRQAAHRAASCVVVTGGGPLAVGVASGLALGGVGTVHPVATGTVLAADLGTGYVDQDRGHDRATASVAAVGRLVPSARTGPPTRHPAPDLVVLADAGAPDPTHVATLMADGQAHLPVRLRDGTGVVGPLVLPGRTACLGCLELHRCACDPDWPAIAAQLVGRPGGADPSCAAATAALATAQALAALDGAVGDGPVPAALEATLELDVSGATLVRRPWAARPDCGCGAAKARRATSHDQATCAAAVVGETIMR